LGYYWLRRRGRNETKTNAYIIPFFKKELGWCVFNTKMKMKRRQKETAEVENNILRDEWRGVEGGMAKHQKKFRLL
jgi:hypothetical protein